MTRRGALGLHVLRRRDVNVFHSVPRNRLGAGCLRVVDLTRTWTMRAAIKPRASRELHSRALEQNKTTQCVLLRAMK